MKFLAKYATRDSKGNEVHKTFNLNVPNNMFFGEAYDSEQNILAIAKRYAQYKLQQRKSFVNGRDYVYSVERI